MILNSKFRFLILFFSIFSYSTIKSQSIYKEIMEVYENERFSFSLLIPKEFHKTFPENGDGITLISPGNKNLRILAWGGHNTVFHTFEERVAEISSRKKILSIQSAHSKLIKRKTIIMEHENQKILRLILLHDDIFYSVECSAPKKEFDQYQKLFEDIIQSFKITK